MASGSDLCQAVLDFTLHGAYPVSESAVTADLPASALTKQLELISRAREDVEVRGRLRLYMLLLWATDSFEKKKKKKKKEQDQFPQLGEHF